MSELRPERETEIPAGAAVTWTVALPDPAATAALASAVAQELHAGDVVALSGGLGTGKTTLARAVIRALAEDAELEVPSPTFTLMQLYAGRGGAVLHADLYRIGDAAELAELGFEDALDGAVALIEWPERAQTLMPPDRLDISLDLAPAAGAEARHAKLIGHGAFAPRLRRIRAIRDLLYRAGWSGAERRRIQGDASSRAYERLHQPSGESAILMIAPPQPDGPPVRRGKPYSAIARLAESIDAFVAVDRGLRQLSFSAPAILAEDLATGLLLEDLGHEGVVDADGPIAERYAEAVRLLAELHAAPRPAVLPVAEGREHVLPPYDLDALTIEVELLLDWYLPHIVHIEASGSVRADFVRLWRELFETILTQPTTWTLRDFHSPNLLWLADRAGTKRVGLLDFQDAVMGHPAYDLVSLLQDARVDAPVELELKLLSAYAAQRRAADPDFDRGRFAEAYAILGAQRATKILGIFARLDKRDGKPQYLRHLPRIEAYLARNLAHPALTGLRQWYVTHLANLTALTTPA